MLVIGVNHKWDACPKRTAPKHRSTHIPNYQSNERESYELNENYLDDNSHVSSGAPFSLLEIVQAYPLLQKGLGHLAAPYLLLLLVTRYNLSYHKTIDHL